MSEPAQVEPGAILAAMEIEATTLERYLAGLHADDLARPSACAGWTNADVVAHLTWAAGYFGDILARALRGDTSQPDLPPQGPARRRRVAEVAREQRAELGDTLREAFQRGNRTLLAAFADVGPADWDRPAAHRVGTIRRLAQSRLNEVAVHHWDIRSVLEPPGHLVDSSLPVLIDLMTRWFELLSSPDPGQADTYRLRFEYSTSGIAPRDLTIGPSAVTFGPAANGPADLVLRGHPEATVLLAMGRITPATATSVYGLTASGRSELLGLLQSRFSAI